MRRTKYQVAVVRFRFEGLQKLLELRKPINEEDDAMLPSKVPWG